MAEGIRAPVLQSWTLAEEGNSSAVQLVEEAEDIHVPELPESLEEASTRAPAPLLAALAAGCNLAGVPSAEVAEGIHVLVRPPAELPAEDMTAVEVPEWSAETEEEEDTPNPKRLICSCTNTQSSNSVSRTYLIRFFMPTMILLD